MEKLHILLLRVKIECRRGTEREGSHTKNETEGDLLTTEKRKPRRGVKGKLWVSLT